MDGGHLHLHNVPEYGFVDEATTAKQAAMFKISIENSTALCLLRLRAITDGKGVLFRYRYRLYKFTYYSPCEVIATFTKYL